MVPLRSLILAVLFAPVAVLAAEMRMCVDAYPHPPYLTPSGGGAVGTLVHKAARATGMKLSVYAAPVARCRAEIERGLAHAYPLTPYAPAELPFAQFPMRAGAIDPARATVHARVVLFRPIGGSAQWDGRAITGVDSKVLVPYGSTLLPSAMRALKVPFDQEGRSLAINFAKMLAGRGDAAAGFEAEGMLLLAQPAFAGKIEVIALPLFEQTYYLGVTKTYYARNRVAVERMWDAIGRLNVTERSNVIERSHKAAEALEK